MCTVTFIPKKEGGFTLTQNRDVRPARFARLLVHEERGDAQIMYPKDSVAGGTWISASSNDRVFCVMNGAFQAHPMGGKYRMSRGLIALQFYDHDHSKLFFEQVNLEHIEPFTMIAFDQGLLYEFRWDGEKRYLLSKDPESEHIWASSTLYDAHWQGRRQFWFNQWLKEYPTRSSKEITAFHHLAGDGDSENDLVMNREDLVRTVSITMVERSKAKICLHLQSMVSDVTLSGRVELLASPDTSKTKTPEQD